jgi:hypothetical protein
VLPLLLPLPLLLLRQRRHCERLSLNLGRVRLLLLLLLQLQTVACRRSTLGVHYLEPPPAHAGHKQITYISID